MRNRTRHVPILLHQRVSILSQPHHQTNAGNGTNQHKLDRIESAGVLPQKFPDQTYQCTPLTLQPAGPLVLLTARHTTPLFANFCMNVLPMTQRTKIGALFV
jgi:hypothetical protein